MKSRVQTPQQQDYLKTLIAPATGVVVMVLSTIMLIVVNPLGQQDVSTAIATLAVALITMSVIVHFAVPAVASKIVDRMILRDREQAGK